MFYPTAINNGQIEQKSSIGYGALEQRETTDIDLNKYLLKLKRRWKPALVIFLITVAITSALSSLLQKTYQAEGKLLFKPNNTASLTGLGQGIGDLKPLLINQSPLTTQKEVITSTPIVQQTIDKLKLVDEQGEPLKPENFKKNLDVKLIGGSDVIQLSYKHPDPYMVADIVNTLMKSYIEGQINNNQQETVNAGKFISEQLPQVEETLAKAESKLSQFREANNIVDLTKEAETSVLELANLNRQIAIVGAELQGVQAQASTLQSQLGLNLQQAIAANQLGQSPVIEAVLDELANVERELAEERKRFRDNHPSIISLEDKKSSLNQQLRGQIRARIGEGVNISEGLLRNNPNRENQLEKFIALEIERLSLQRQLVSLDRSKQTYLQRVKQLPRLEKEEQELLREVAAARTTYETLLGSLQEVQIVQNQQAVNAQIIEPAELPERGSSGRLALMVLGILLGLLLSNMSVMLLELQDQTLKTIADIKEKLPYPVLGIIPQNTDESSQGIVVQQQPDSFTSELYRMIQSNLKFLNSDQPVQVILMTSSVPEEGKSTVSANVAAAIAQLGRRVLLIDGDLRNPSQHRLWNISDRVGLKDILTKSKQASPVQGGETLTHNLPLREAICQPMEKLDLLIGGAIPSNPLALLDSEAMNNLIAQARQEYDLVIIDAPPLPVTADVLTLSNMVDGILFVSRPGVVDRESAAFANETLALAKQRVMGMVINGVKPNEFERYSYHAKYARRYFLRTKASGTYSSETVTI
ncbi:polysaccharide biosynthesis tyrosine autokinase [Pleurocapsales cyanobacterium LEGE 06147]|nr:polysaccharide biosynthesis tyrosine autokinase [Pleurocapsales cyanobacterium LEGE 06147]